MTLHWRDILRQGYRGGLLLAGAFLLLSSPLQAEESRVFPTGTVAAQNDPLAENDPTPAPTNSAETLDSSDSDLVPFSELEATLEDLGVNLADTPGTWTGPMEANSLHFFFAVPEYDSRISLGVFNASGLLVRTLAQNLPEEDFPIGLNGLMGSWDGRNDFDQTVPAGTYEVRGFAVGDFTEGEAHFPYGPLPMGWGVSFGDDLPVRGILSMAVGPNNTLILLGLTDAPAPPTGDAAEPVAGEEMVPEKVAVILAYDPVQGQRLWSRLLPGAHGGAWILGRPATEAVVVAAGADIEVLDPLTGAALVRGLLPASLGEPGGVSIEVGKEDLRISTPDGLARLSRTDLQPLEEELRVPEGLVRFSLPEEGAMGLDEDGRLWVRDRTWTIFLHEDEAVFDDFWPGQEGRFWALVREEHGGEVRVGQFDRDGDFLRQVTPESFLGSPVSLAVGPDENTLFVLVRGADAYQELLGLRKDAESGRWLVFFRRESVPMEWLTEGEFRRLPLRMQLETSSALGTGRESSTLRLALIGETVYLTDPSGLRLGPMVELPGAMSASAEVLPGHPPRLLFRWLSDGRLLEREVGGLEWISRLTVGEFAWPPSEP